ncbi:MAG: adenosylcobinamide-GDP ribazoletransferase [Pseudomonadota bacterium]
MRYSPADHGQAFVSALQFLTTLPVTQSDPPDERVQGLSLLWYPAIGLLLGTLLCLAAGWLQGPYALTAALLLAIWAGLTGALHLDGLADCADAWVGGMGGREKTLALLKDPTCGVMAVVVIVVVLLLKWVSLTVLLETRSLVWLVLPAFFARLSVYALFLRLPYVREAGIGAVLASHFPANAAKTLLVITGLALAVVLPLGAFLALSVAVCAVVWWVCRASRRRLGGFTGDVAGAQIELVEVTVLLTLAFLLS